MEIIEMKDIAIYGDGGYGREIACMLTRIVNSGSDWRFVGFFDDDNSLKGSSNAYGKVLGDMDVLNAWPTPISLVIAIGSPDGIKKVVDRVANNIVDFPNLIDPTVTFLDPESFAMGKGNIIGCNCFVSCNVEIGDFNIFNGYIPVGHDVRIGDFNVVMPSCNISGGVEMGNANFLGVQSIVLQNVKIGNNTRIGAGSVVIRNTKDGYLYMGNPARKIEL